MARTRSIKPGFFHDTRLTAQSPLARLLFTGLWCYADREGRLEDDLRQIKHDILPDDRCNIDKLLSDLASGDRPFIYRYEVNGHRYIQIRTWHRHENPHVKEPQSVIPPMPESGASPVPAADKSETGTGNSRTSPASRARALEPSSLVPVPISLNPESGTRNREPAAGRQPSVNGSSDPGGWPLTRAWLAKTNAGGKLIEELISLARSELPSITDEALVNALQLARKPNQRSPGLFRQTLPEVIREEVRRFKAAGGEL